MSRYPNVGDEVVGAGKGDAQLVRAARPSAHEKLVGLRTQSGVLIVHELDFGR